jgi:hypothetical protein
VLERTRALHEDAEKKQQALILQLGVVPKNVRTLSWLSRLFSRSCWQPSDCGHSLLCLFFQPFEMVVVPPPTCSYLQTAQRRRHPRSQGAVAGHFGRARLVRAGANLRRPGWVRIIQPAISNTSTPSLFPL